MDPRPFWGRLAVLRHRGLVAKITGSNAKVVLAGSLARLSLRCFRRRGRGRAAGGARPSVAGCPPSRVARKLISLTSANDTQKDSTGPDTIFAGAGNDVIDALAGDDCVDLGLGNDRGQGGAGDDLVLGVPDATRSTAARGPTGCSQEPGSMASSAALGTTR